MERSAKFRVAQRNEDPVSIESFLITDPPQRLLSMSISSEIGEFSGRSADQILSNRIFDHSSWHFFQARSWLDFAHRTQYPSAIHYAAFELRYGLEYLLFELLVIANKGLTRELYEKCIGSPTEMKKMLSGKVGQNYQRLAEFSRIVISETPMPPNVHLYPSYQSPATYS